MSETSEQSSLPVNRQIAYLRTLASSKKGLPHGQLVCVCTSHTISSTDALLQLASSIGPHIAILQVHADIIDDWSEETVRQLTLLAKRHSFLIWEGGRILNATVDIVAHEQNESRDMKKAVVDLIRKKYTKGVIKTASWAGIVTAWASGVAVDNQEADILIPTLKAAARETVADTVQTITTEITADYSRDLPRVDEDGDGADDNRSAQHLSSDYVVDDSGLGLPLRKASTISLTRTITQHTEDSTEQPEIQERRNSLEDATYHTSVSPIDNLPPPPLLARGLVLCLPATGDTSFTPEYRRSCIAAARANQDFVMGFTSSEPWDVVSQREDILALDDDTAHSTREKKSNSKSLDEQQYLAIFSWIPNRVNKFQPVYDMEDDDESDEEIDPVTPVVSSRSSDFLNPQAARLHTLVGQALKLREASRRSDEPAESSVRIRSDFKPMHIPIIPLP